MNIVLRSVAIAVSFIAGLHTTEETKLENCCVLKSCPHEIIGTILKDVVVDCLSAGRTKEFGNLSFVCKDWNKILDNKQFFYYEPMKLSLSFMEYCELSRFLSGKLIYTSESGKKIELRIADLENPLDGEFDLSKCGNTSKYLSINTGYRKEKRIENVKKVEIWFAPRFLIKKDLEGSANYYNAIFPDWNASATVGIIWTLGSWDSAPSFDYLTNKPCSKLSNIDLYEMWQMTLGGTSNPELIYGSNVPIDLLHHIIRTYGGGLFPLFSLHMFSCSFC